MTLEEFSSQFDTLYNNALSVAAPGLDEYEKSVFLTKAQNEIVKNYFNPNGNKYKEGFDGSPKRQTDFSMLLKHYTMALQQADSMTSFDPRAHTVTFPSDAFIVLNEQIMFTKDSAPVRIKEVIPIAYDVYTRVMSKPYKEPLKNQAWRLIMGTGTAPDSGLTPVNAPKAEVIVSTNDKNAYLPEQMLYRMRYVRRPAPIILTNLSSVVGDVTLEGKAGPSDCELDASVHEEILQRAVELAKASYASDQSGQAQMQNQITVGQRSE